MPVDEEDFGPENPNEENVQGEVGDPENQQLLVEPVLAEAPIVPQDHNEVNEQILEGEPGFQNLANEAGSPLNVGRVLIKGDSISDPVFMEKFSQSNLDDLRLSFFDNVPGKEIRVSSQWAHFFASMLLSPETYNWAKNFIDSEAWAFFNKSLKTSLIKVPDCSPVNTPCYLEAESVSSHSKNNQLSIYADSPPAKKAKGNVKKNKTASVETEVRRSPRLKESNKGFKPGSCADKRCLACLPNPPDLSRHLIKKLGSELCKIDEYLLTEEALNQKKKPVRKVINNEETSLSEIVVKDFNKQVEAGTKKQAEAVKKKLKKKQTKENKKQVTDKSIQDNQGGDVADQGGATPKKLSKE